MRRQDFRQPDKWRHFKKTVKRYAADAIQRLRRVDIAAQALDWEVVGVDMSYWQGEIVDPVKLAGMVDFVIVRAGYGNDFEDPRLEEYRQVFHEQGIPFGCYWYAKPDKDWKKHADNFFAYWATDPGKIPPTFDLEEKGGKNKTDLESWWQKMYARFNSWRDCSYDDDMTYTSAGFLNAAIGLTNWLKHSLLFVAHWTVWSQPILPNEWAIPGFTWKFWQWSATGKGSDYGVSSKYIDLVRYNGTRAQFNAEFGITAPPPPPPPPLPAPIIPIKRVKVRRDIIDFANVRAQPSLEAADLGDLMEDSIVPVVGKYGKFYRFEGWVHEDMVTDV